MIHHCQHCFIISYVCFYTYIYTYTYICLCRHIKICKDIERTDEGKRNERNIQRARELARKMNRTCLQNHRKKKQKYSFMVESIYISRCMILLMSYSCFTIRLTLCRYGATFMNDMLVLSVEVLYIGIVDIYIWLVWLYIYTHTHFCEALYIGTACCFTCSN